MNKSEFFEVIGFLAEGTSFMLVGMYIAYGAWYYALGYLIVALLLANLVGKLIIKNYLNTKYINKSNG